MEEQSREVPHFQSACAPRGPQVGRGPQPRDGDGGALHGRRRSRPHPYAAAGHFKTSIFSISSMLKSLILEGA